jgi:hypothetical protein
MDLRFRTRGTLISALAAALFAGCGVTSPGPYGTIDGAWGGVGARITFNHDTTSWVHECFGGVVPLPIRLSADGSFLAQGVMTGDVFGAQVMRLYGAVHADTMQLYFQIQDGSGNWSAPGASLLVRGQAMTEPPDFGFCPE